jgi:hypothetical protein
MKLTIEYTGAWDSQAERIAVMLSTVNLIWVMPAEETIMPLYIQRPLLFVAVFFYWYKGLSA